MYRCGAAPSSTLPKAPRRSQQVRVGSGIAHLASASGFGNLWTGLPREVCSLPWEPFSIGRWDVFQKTGGVSPLQLGRWNAERAVRWVDVVHLVKTRCVAAGRQYLTVARVQLHDSARPNRYIRFPRVAPPLGAFRNPSLNQIDRILRAFLIFSVVQTFKNYVFSLREGFKACAEPPRPTWGLGFQGYLQRIKRRTNNAVASNSGS
jgi:hypothetical protein